MNKLLILRVAHTIYLGILLTFILFYFEVYQPNKFHDVCAEISAKKVLRQDFNPNAANIYDSYYKDCVSEKSITLLTLFKSN